MYLRFKGTNNTKKHLKKFQKCTYCNMEVIKIIMCFLWVYSRIYIFGWHVNITSWITNHLKIGQFCDFLMSVIVNSLQNEILIWMLTQYLKVTIWSSKWVKNLIYKKIIMSSHSLCKIRQWSIFSNYIHPVKLTVTQLPILFCHYTVIKFN